MDFYQYYLRRIEARPNKKLAVQACRDIVMKLFEEGPTTWSIESGAAFLAALYEVKAPGVDLLSVFNEVEASLFAEIQGLRLDLAAVQETGILSIGCEQPKPRKNKRKKER